MPLDRKVLYLDDEEINLMFFREMFKNDFSIQTESSIKNAIAYLQKNKVDFILTDQLMPEMTGVEFLKALRADHIATNSYKIMVSGYAKAGEVSEAIETRLIDEFVSKPWTYEGIMHVLRAKI